MRPMSKFKWLWIRLWGSCYVLTDPYKSNTEYIIYHHRIYDKKLWNKKIKEDSK